MSRSTVGLALLVVALAGCHGPAPVREQVTCAHVQSGRRVRGVALCEDVWTCERPPGGPLDRVGVRRLTPCGNAMGPVVLVLPDRYMSSETGQVDADVDLRLYLAQAGVQTWSLDYRTHVAGLLGDDPSAAMAGWSEGTFVGDVGWAVGFVHGVTPKPLALVGIGDGATLAYAAVRAGVPGVGGIVAVDGALAPAPPVQTESRVVEARVGVLDWTDGEPLLRAARVDAGSPSPIPGFVTAGDALADALHRAPGWGAPGGLASETMALADPEALARYLASQDRWWPAAVARSRIEGAPPHTVPVLAFAAGARGRAWIDAVRAGATTFGGPHAEVRVLGGQGHLDVLLGRQAAPRVYEPIRRWLGK
jgi:hypothetical protein